MKKMKKINEVNEELCHVLLLASVQWLVVHGVGWCRMRGGCILSSQTQANRHPSLLIGFWIKYQDKPLHLLSYPLSS